MATSRKKSLDELFSRETRLTGTGTTNTWGSKKIRSPGGQERYVRGYIVDFVEPADETVTRFDTNKYAGNPSWNMEKFHTFEKVKTDNTFHAFPQTDKRTNREPKDKT